MTFDESPRISVILPIFNCANTLKEAIDSILTQSFSDFELIVLNDGSTDKTGEIVRAYTDPRVRFYDSTHRLGLARRLNQAIDLSRGHYIARMDGDDIAFYDRLERQIDFLDTHPSVDLVGGQAIVFHDSGECIGLLPAPAYHAAITRQPWRTIPIPHPTWMGRAEWFKLHRYSIPEVIRAEDQELLLRAAPKSNYANLEHPILAYRQGPFKFFKTFTARRALLFAQIAIFSERREFKNIFLALTMAVIKIAIDMLASLPRCQHLFFMRMSNSVPDHIVLRMRALSVNKGKLSKK